MNWSVMTKIDPPVKMLLWCPMCSTRHVDVGEFAFFSHHTHACQECGLTWRPAVVATVGVQFLPGFSAAEELPIKNSPPADASLDAIQAPTRDELSSKDEEIRLLKSQLERLQEAHSQGAVDVV